MWNSNYWEKYQQSWSSNAGGVSCLIVSINKKSSNRCSHDVVTWDVDLYISTAFCKSLLSDGVDCSCYTILYRGILMWLADFNPHCSDEYWFSELLLKQRACDTVQVHRCFALKVYHSLFAVAYNNKESAVSSSRTQHLDCIYSVFPDRLQHSFGYFANSRGFIFSYFSITLSVFLL